MSARETVLSYPASRTPGAISQLGAGRRVRADDFLLATFLVDLCGRRRTAPRFSVRADSRAATWSHEDAIDNVTFSALGRGRAVAGNCAVQLFHHPAPRPVKI